MSTSSSRRGVLVGLGIAVIVSALLASVGLWSLGVDRRSDAVEGFARAPVGCDTTLDFVETGEYFVFIERAGRLDGVRGDCDVEGAYDVGSETPEVDITIVDPDGALLDLDRTVTDLDYAEAGFVGAAAFTIDITETDDHVVRVESSGNEVFVVAVGRDPSEGVAVLQGAAAALGILGLLLGGGLILLGVRRSGASETAPNWAPGAIGQPMPFAPGQAPQGPPVYGQQAGPPQYRQPPPPQPPQPPQYGQPQPPPPHYGRPQPASGQPQPYVQPPPPPPPPVGPATVPGQPVLPGQPGWGPSTPPPASVEPIEWAPRGPGDAAPPIGAAEPDEHALGRSRGECESDAERTQERPPPPSS